MNRKKQLIKQLLIFSAVCLTYIPAVYSDQDELMGLNVEDLLDVEVITVAKKVKSLNNSPAAIFVMSQDDIRLIGATSMSEALRLSPGLKVQGGFRRDSQSSIHDTLTLQGDAY